MKRLFDVVSSILLIFFLLPVLFLTALFIFVEDGLPIFFVQKRFGFLGDSFYMYKYRSMHNKNMFNQSYFTISNDPRITKVGKWIRKLSIDELPQLFNVLKGDMSLVGPRPDVPEQRSQYSDEDWSLRCSVKPGITGLAQVQLRSEGTEEQRLNLDLWYTKHRSMFLDLKIIYLTIKRISGQGGN